MNGETGALEQFTGAIARHDAAQLRDRDDAPASSTLWKGSGQEVLVALCSALGLLTWG
jgi:hypothetical protein